MLKNITLFLLFLFAASISNAQSARNQIILDAFNAGSAAFDIETSQHCFHAGTCYEGNPFMPTSRAGAYTFDMSLVAVESVIAWKTRNSKIWVIFPLVPASYHIAAGIANGIRFGW